jgi:predicted nucleic acid-binding Zn ribbon protein
VTKFGNDGMDKALVLYVYKCPECDHRGDTHLAGDGHDGESTKCSVCGGVVTLEWDGGVVLVRLPGSAH